MRMHITLDMNTAADIAARADLASGYWAADTSVEETLPAKLADLRAALRKPIEVGTQHLEVIARNDFEAVDTLVQLALFGELRFG